MPLFGRSSKRAPNDTSIAERDEGKKEEKDGDYIEQVEVAVLAEPFSTELEKSLVRKLDMRLIPLVMSLYVLSFLDRSNIGYGNCNAKIASMDKDLKLSSSDYRKRYPLVRSFTLALIDLCIEDIISGGEWLLTIFYIAYIVFEWFALMWKVLPPHIWAAFCVIGWGITATLQSATYSFQGLMTARFFLGFFESGFGPGIPYLLSFFYLRHELGFRIGIFLSGAPLATCFAGALAYGITSGDPSGIQNWRLLFLVEGIPCILMGIIVFFMLPDSPDKCGFLSREEKDVARARGVQQVGAEEAHRIGHVRWPEIGAALMDVKNWLTALMYFSCNVSFSSLPVFLPTILLQFGPQFTSVTAQGLSAPPYFLAFLLTILSSYIADRTRQRGLTIILLSIIGTIGYLLLSLTSSTTPRYIGVFLAAMGVFPAIANIIPWVLNNQGSDTKRGAGIAILNIVGQCGPLLGTRLYPASEGPYYRKGMWVCAAFMAFNAVLALALRCLLVWENKKLDERFGVVAGRVDEEGGKEKGKEVLGGFENDGPKFRYIL